jgi:serine/threonine-protein kinase
VTDQLRRLTTALAGRYAIVRELGRGGMATVYLAQDLRHGRPVAIKVLRPELGEVLGADRFGREIRVVAALTHPHIVALFDSGEADGLLYYVMPYIDGESLRQKLGRERQLPIDEAVGIVRQVATALAHAHARGLVHRDVKPENILLRDGTAMVTDFGIALGAESAPDGATGERLTATGLMVGTLEYMSPEQAAGERVLDARSDVYSLACVLYELLAGAAPHSDTGALRVIARRLTEPPPRVRRQRPTVPLAVDEAIARALAVDPTQRFSGAMAFAEALVQRAVVASAPRGPSIAVLPFVNLSPDPENEFFADGITEDVIAQLSKIRSLRVISRRSVMPFKQRDKSLREIGATLDVGTLLEGSVRRAGSRVRIVAQLIDAESDRHLWADTYDRELTDIFAIQTDVALQIAGALETELSPEEQRRIRQEPTEDIEAYQLYLLARHCLARWTGDGVDQALKHLEQAVARDPNYAKAYATIGNAYTDIGLGVAGALPAPEAFRRAKAAVGRALEIDPKLPEGYAVLGYLSFATDFDWARGEALLKQAIELDPNSGDAYDFYGLLLAAVERYDEALVMQRRAHELDPLAHRMDASTTLLRAGRHAEALDAVTKVLEVDPHLAIGHVTRGWALFLNGRREEGVAAIEGAVRLAPESSLYLGQLGQAYGMVGRTDEARAVLRRIEEMGKGRYISPYHLAYVYTGLEEPDRAMDWLERAYQERAGAIFGIKGSFLLAPLRRHPRFQALLRRMNLA